MENNAGRVALMRGPIVYALESVDQTEPVKFLSIPPDPHFAVEFRADMLGGAAVIKGTAQGQSPAWSELLYVPFDRLQSRRRPRSPRFRITAIPIADQSTWLCGFRRRSKLVQRQSPYGRRPRGW